MRLFNLGMLVLSLNGYLATGQTLYLAGLAVNAGAFLLLTVAGAVWPLAEECEE